MNEYTVRELGRLAAQEKPHPNSLFPPSLYYRFFKLLVSYTQPSLAVVLGVCGGGDCLYMLWGDANVNVHGIDLAYDHPVNILTIRNTYGDRFKFIKLDSIDAAKLYSPESVDILFIDTIHTYDHTMAEFEAWKPKMREHGIVCLDDLFRKGMQQAWNDLPGTKVRMDELHIGGGAEDGGFGVILL